MSGFHSRHLGGSAAKRRSTDPQQLGFNPNMRVNLRDLTAQLEEELSPTAFTGSVYDFALASYEHELQHLNIQRAAQLSSENAGHDAFRFNEEQNTLIVSTPALENAVKYGGVHSISLKGQTYEVVAYAIPPDDTIKGVIHGIPDEDSEQDVLNNLVTARNPKVLHARRMGRSKSAVVLFKGQKVPFCIMYGNVEYKCNLYKKKIEVCGTCGGVGHRTDVCPRPKEQRCKICNALNPTDGHACSPSCGICGKAHPTGDTRCKQRFKTPYILQQRQWEKKKKQEESRFKEVDFPQLSKGRSRSRSRSRASVRSTSRQRSGSRRRSRSRRRSSSRQRISWAGVTDHKASEKKSKKAKTQNDKLDEILVMMRQLQEENKALRVMVEKTEKENITEWNKFRELLGEYETEDVTNIGEWMKCLLATAERTTKVIPEEADVAAADRSTLTLMGG
ncbi:hypothetical protein HPB47_021956 [Ixodes persulcatus]|uniref:Uncharacterized protein n=1 Tax=Ixodes persulcatus TaxID=34615 RepID=A0AC60QD97_IXOPE|nr:hypothetical protein HPB47_021956 [Ixodes persulcatus]